MKTIYFQLILLFVFCYSSFPQNYKTEWVTKDLRDYMTQFWLTNNDSVAISLIERQESNSKDLYHKLEFWDLYNKKLLKTIDLKNEEFLDVNFNSVNGEFYYYSKDTLYIRNLEDISLIKRVPISENTYIIWYNTLGNEYCISEIENDAIILKKMNPDNLHIFSTDTLQISLKNQNTLTTSDNGAYFAVINNKKEIFIYNTKECKLISTKNYEYNITSVNISNSGKFIATKSWYEDDFPIKIYDITNDSINFFIKNSSSYFHQIKFSLDDKQVLVCSDDEQLLYEMFNKEPVITIKEEISPIRINFCLSDNSIVYIGNDLTLILKDLKSGVSVELTQIDHSGKNQFINSVRLTKEPDVFFVSGREGKISERNLTEGKIIDTFRINHNNTYILNSRNREINDTLVIYDRSELTFLDLKTKTILKKFSMKDIYNTLLSNDSKWFVGANWRSGTFLTKLTDKPVEKKIFYLDSGRLSSGGAAFSSDSRFLATGGTDNILRVYDLNNLDNDTTPVIISKYPTPKNPISGIGINYISFIDNDTKIVTSSYDFNRFMVWSAINGDSLFNPACPENIFKNGDGPAINYIQQRTNFNDLITSSSYGGIFIWDNNFQFKSYHSFQKDLNFQGIGSIDYNQTTNQLLLGYGYNSIALVSLEGETDIKEQTNYTNPLILFPNPVKDFITIQTSEVLKTSEVYKVQIFDVLGIEIMSEEIHPMTGSQRMNVSALSTGVYFIRVGEIFEKFMKM